MDIKLLLNQKLNNQEFKIFESKYSKNTQSSIQMTSILHIKKEEGLLYFYVIDLIFANLKQTQ